MIEPRGKGKAEVSTRNLLSAAVEARDWPYAADVLRQYGTYLELIGQGAPVGEERVFTSVSIS